MRSSRERAARGPVSEGPEGTSVRVHVVPGSAAPGIGGFDPWRGALTVRVAAQAREGQANAEACRRLAEALSVESARVSVASGARSREKTLRVEGLRAEEVRTRLEALP